MHAEGPRVDSVDTFRGVRYDVRYRDPTGPPRTKTFRRRSDADRYAPGPSLPPPRDGRAMPSGLEREPG